jgi:hypothetical protein
MPERDIRNKLGLGVREQARQFFGCQDVDLAAFAFAIVLNVDHQIRVLGKIPTPTAPLEEMLQDIAGIFLGALGAL